MPWTDLRLQDPIGAFSARKLAALGGDAAQCRALLRRAGAGDRSAPPVSADADCGYTDGIRLTAGEDEIAFLPQQPVTSCPVAAALFILERQVIEPAARRHLGSEVTAIEHAGSYSCRRIYGRDEGDFSEHATADAFDITAFRLADGSRVSIAGDWSSNGPEGAFLREVRDGACDLFATVLSPDYNQAHADHLHLDQAERGRSGWGVCR